MRCVRCGQRGRDRLVRRWRGVMMCVWCRHQLVLNALGEEDEALNNARRARLEREGLL